MKYTLFVLVVFAFASTETFGSQIQDRREPVADVNYLLDKVVSLLNSIVVGLNKDQRYAEAGKIKFLSLRVDNESRNLLNACVKVINNNLKYIPGHYDKEVPDYLIQVYNEIIFYMDHVEQGLAMQGKYLSAFKVKVLRKGTILRVLPAFNQTLDALVKYEDYQ